MIKLLIFAPNLNGGGAERVLVNYLSNLDYNRFSVTLVLAVQKGVFLELVPDEVQIVNLNKSKTVFCLFKLRSLISKLQPDIVYSTLIRSSIVLSLALIHIKHKPKVILRSPNSPKLLKDNRMLNIVQEKLISYAYSNSDLVIAQTLEMKNELIHYHGIEPHKVEVVLNPIDKKAIDSLLHDSVNPYDINAINIVAAGRLTKQKGFDILIRAFSIVAQKKMCFQLYILGDLDGDQAEFLQNLVIELKLTNIVHFVGFKSNPYQYFKYAATYVLSSRWEGLPNTVLECLYIGTPVISTNCIPTMKELINHGENGFIVDVDDSIELADAILNCKNISSIQNSECSANIDINLIFSEVIK